jgi:putative DNA modification/repair radical SAM protein
VGELLKKLRVLADSAKYDASCASTKTTRDSAAAPGICHSYTPDGRCISLLKILLTNYCIFDCVYCVNRASNDIERARFAVDEVVRLTIDFYQRNYIDGLFLSSGVIQNPDYTMEQLVAVARSLRMQHEFRGYIHLKAMPGVSTELIREAGIHADRLSVNIELPTPAALQQLAPDKSHAAIESVMADARNLPPTHLTAGQTTQMIVGATDTSDADILRTAGRLYARHELRRVYFTAYSPIPGQESLLTGKPTPLVREHRLYQADQLVRQYGFAVEELAGNAHPDLDLRMDPKLAWAIRHPEHWPVDVNAAPRRILLRVPAFGRHTVTKILSARRHTRLRERDLLRMGVRLRIAKHFIVTHDSRPPMNAARMLPALFGAPPHQLALQL